jgi:hypothetical protein
MATTMAGGTNRMHMLIAGAHLVVVNFALSERSESVCPFLKLIENTFRFLKFSFRSETMPFF